jgi:hypothetical protein
MEDLAANVCRGVPGMQPLAQTHSADRGVDLVVWNDDPESARSALGNPVLIQVKYSTKPLSSQFVDLVAHDAKALGARRIILFTNLPLTRAVRERAERLRRELGVGVLVMTIDDVLKATSAEDVLARLASEADHEEPNT